jgi:exopolysaccharide biosynthesis polyprenyl glycosylphosphotransferase
MNKKKTFVLYALDALAAALAWIVFFMFRKATIEPWFPYNTYKELIDNKNFYIGILVVPIFWGILHFLSGYYSSVYRKSRLDILFKTFIFTLLGSIILFFAIIIDDVVGNYTGYYYSTLVLWLLNFILIFIERYIITSIHINELKKGIVGFNTIIIGSGEKALELYLSYNKAPYISGYRFIGYIKGDQENIDTLNPHLKLLGNYSTINTIVQQLKITDVLLAIETENKQEINEVLTLLRNYNVTVKAISDIHDIISGSVKTTSLYDEPLKEILPDVFPQWQKASKRMFDIITSLIAILILLPVYLLVGILVKVSSQGPIFYTQERIGLNGKPFRIIKFRTMFTDAEKLGPSLATDNDPRITKIGRFMRKTRLDEIPQFFNVLKGDMSVVGPRPERQFYINKIVEKAPHYRYVLRVKPGITSWGQVKYGYAETVDQMVERLRFDILYVENISLILDIKIILATISTVINAKGK